MIVEWHMMSGTAVYEVDYSIIHSYISIASCSIDNISRLDIHSILEK